MLEKNTYLLRKKILTLLGAEFSIVDGDGNLALYAKQKAFKLREDIRLFSDREMKNEVLQIKARNIIDFSAAYDVFDVRENKIVGTLKRKGWKSMLRDEWVIMDANGQEFAKAQEDSMSLALIRRFLMNIIPQDYDVLVGDRRVMDIKQKFNPFVFKMDLMFEDEGFDKRLGMALAVLLGAIEGRQE